MLMAANGGSQTNCIIEMDFIISLSDSLCSFLSLVSYQNPDKGVFRCVKLQIDSNWGNIDYTCLYSFRVHGKIVEAEGKSTAKPPEST